MSRFTVVITGRDGSNVHAHCFEDFARALADALRQAGQEVTPLHLPGRLILFGANNMTDEAGMMPKDAIIFNTEQVGAASADPRRFMESWAAYKDRVVWDYSLENIRRLRELGLRKLVHCPLGYVPSMSSIKPAAVQDIDVLHYGSINPHRAAILDAIEARGLKVERLFGVYNAERDAVIARSKVVVNLHFYQGAIFEIFRVSHLLANRKCVVTEDGGVDAQLEGFASLACFSAPAEHVAAVCDRLVKDKTRREWGERSGFAMFSRLDLVENVKQALEATKDLDMVVP